ncbi:hypothetical protein, partial [Muricoccus vinaceus]
HHVKAKCPLDFQKTDSVLKEHGFAEPTTVPQSNSDVLQNAGTKTLRRRINAQGVFQPSPSEAPAKHSARRPVTAI